MTGHLNKKYLINLSEKQLLYLNLKALQFVIHLCNAYIRSDILLLNVFLLQFSKCMYNVYITYYSVLSWCMLGYERKCFAFNYYVTFTLVCYDSCNFVTINWVCFNTYAFFYSLMVTRVLSAVYIMLCKG